VTGSRAWPASRATEVHDALNAAFYRAMAARGIDTWCRVEVTLVSGACPRGVDAIAEKYAAELGWTVERHEADWDNCGPDCPPTPHRKSRRPGDVDHPGTLDTYCPKAGPRRNTLVASLGAHDAVGLPIGKRWSGTRDCMAKAARAGIPTTTYEGQADA